MLQKWVGLKRSRDTSLPITVFMTKNNLWHSTTLTCCNSTCRMSFDSWTYSIERSGLACTSVLDWPRSKLAPGWALPSHSVLPRPCELQGAFASSSSRSNSSTEHVLRFSFHSACKSGSNRRQRWYGDDLRGGQPRYQTRPGSRPSGPRYPQVSWMSSTTSSYGVK